MAQKMIRLTYGNDVYELAFTRETIKQMEASGFEVNSLLNGSKLGSMTEMLFQGAFMARNRGVKRKVMDGIWERVSDKEAVRDILLDMYSEVLGTMVDTAAVTDGKNVSWEVV